MKVATRSKKIYADVTSSFMFPSAKMFCISASVGKCMCHSWQLVENWIADYQMDIMIGLFFNPCCDSYFIYTLFTWVIMEQMLQIFFFHFFIHMNFVSLGNIEFKPLTWSEEQQYNHLVSETAHMASLLGWIMWRTLSNEWAWLKHKIHLITHKRKKWSDFRLNQPYPQNLPFVFFFCIKVIFSCFTGKEKNQKGE